MVLKTLSLWKLTSRFIYCLSASSYTIYFRKMEVCWASSANLIVSDPARWLCIGLSRGWRLRTDADALVRYSFSSVTSRCTAVNKKYPLVFIWKVFFSLQFLSLQMTYKCIKYPFCIVLSWSTIIVFNSVSTCYTSSSSSLCRSLLHDSVWRPLRGELDMRRSLTND